MEENKLIKFEVGQLQKVGNVIAVTNKLLAIIEPQLIPYRKKDKWGYCTPDKKIVIECKYEEAPERFSEGLAKVQLSGKYGFIDNKGNEIVPCKYNGAGWYSDGLASVILNKKYGYIDKLGNEIIPCKYDNGKTFREGLAAVMLDLYWGF